MSARVWGVVPAAGVGRRMGAGEPKQYLPLAGRTVIEHTLERLLASPRVDGVTVAVSPGDRRFEALPVSARVTRATGGAERADSVRNALASLCEAGGPAAEEDWALVHDVRPCLPAEDLEALIDAVLSGGQGGLLAAPVRDTIKRVEEGTVTGTVPREGLWHALTPQMFRVGELRDALAAAARDGVAVTDEAQAMERAGYAPQVVAGRADNIKITHREDLALAAFFLERLAPGAGAGAAMAGGRDE